MHCNGLRILIILFITDKLNRYEYLMAVFKKAFLCVRDKIALHKQFYCNRQTFFQKASNFFLGRLEWKNKLCLDLAFEDLDILNGFK